MENLGVKEYKSYLLEKQLTVPYVQKFWENKFRKPELNWRFIWSTFRTCTNEPRITSLMWKILHNIYPTGILLYKMGKQDDDQCKFCHERDTVEHCFVECCLVKKMWIVIEVYLGIKLKAINILLGYDLKACNHRWAYVMICIGILCAVRLNMGNIQTLTFFLKENVK